MKLNYKQLILENVKMREKSLIYLFIEKAVASKIKDYETEIW